MILIERPTRGKMGLNKRRVDPFNIGIDSMKLAIEIESCVIAARRLNLQVS